MRQGHLQGLIAELEGRFEAAVRAEEDAAARDLAFSLSQDVPVVEEIFRRGGSVRLDRSEVPVSSVGHDFLRAGSWLVPIDRAVVALGGTRTPIAEADVLIAVLRRWARSGTYVEVGCGAPHVAGYLRTAGVSDLLVEGGARVRIPLARVDYIRRVRGGSADAL